MGGERKRKRDNDQNETVQLVFLLLLTEQFVMKWSKILFYTS